MQKPSRGVVYVAYGRAAIDQFYIALRHLAKRHDWPVAVVSGEQITPVKYASFQVIPFECKDPGARLAKLNLDRLTPFDHTLYMDADTRVRGDISAIWDILGDGWDMCCVPNGTKTRVSAMKHFITFHGDAGLAEKNTTFKECGGWPFIGWQGGVMAWRDTEAVHSFFEAWREEWQRWEGQDQGALVRAYRRRPVRCWPLGRSFNGGCLVGHYHAHARRRGMIGSIA